MLIYIIKMVAASAVFYALYYFLFRNEKMLVFNRFYLLAALVISFFIPLISFTTNVPVSPVMITNETFVASSPLQTVTVQPDYTYLYTAATILFCAVSVFFFLRLFMNLLKLNRRTKNQTSFFKNKIRFILIPDPITPFSFLNSVFVNEDEYNSGLIESAVLDHEMEHVRQKHSWDILLIEILQVISWFNPVLYLYKRSVKINHELLADEMASRNYSLHSYQHILLSRSVSTELVSLTSSFNFLTIKKRLIMLQKKYHPLRASLKALVVIPVLGGLIFVLANRIQAQQTENNSVSVQKDNSSSTGISNDQMREFRNILNSYKVDGHLNSVNFRKNLSEQDRQKLQDLYLDMNNQQKSEQAIGFIPAPPPLPRVSPAGSQLQEWQNGSVYGVWVDGKRISNINLKDYAPADFSQVSVSKLSKNAINYGKHYYQVDLMTNAYYEKYLEENNANKNQYKMFFRFKAPKAPIIPLSSDTSLPDNIKSVEITTPSGKAIATITYKNGKKVTGDISTKEKLEAFENKYGVKIPAPPPPPPTPRPHHAPKVPQAPPAPPALSEKSAPPAPAHPSIPPPPPPPPTKHKK